MKRSSFVRTTRILPWCNNHRSSDRRLEQPSHVHPTRYFSRRYSFRIRRRPTRNRDFHGRDSPNEIQIDVSRNHRARLEETPSFAQFGWLDDAHLDQSLCPDSGFERRWSILTYIRTRENTLEEISMPINRPFAMEVSHTHPFRNDDIDLRT